MCDECSRWFHGAGVSLSSEDIRVLGRISNCRWFCDSCLPQTKAVEEVAKRTRKLSSIANDLQNSITKIPPIELSAKKGIQNVEKVSPSKNIYEYQYEVRVSGIPENNEASRIKRQSKDKEVVENVCSSIGCTYPIKECRRIGKFVDGRTRKLLVTFNDSRALVAKASEKELYKPSRVLIKPGLSEADMRKEQVVLKKRWDLMNSRKRKEDLRIHKFRLYQSTSSGEIEVKLDWQPTLCKLSLKRFYLNPQGFLSLERRLKVLNKFLLITSSYLFVTETWFDSQTSSVVFPNNNPAQIFRSDRSLGKYGGTAAFGWDPSKSTTLTSQFDCGCSTVIEGILFLLIYNPPISSEYRISDDRLTNFIQESLRQYSWSTDDKIIVIGDFNFPGFDWSSLPFHDIPNYPILSFFLMANGFSQYVDIVTHKSRNTLNVFFVTLKLVSPSSQSFVTTLIMLCYTSHSQHNIYFRSMVWCVIPEVGSSWVQRGLSIWNSIFQPVFFLFKMQQLIFSIHRIGFGICIK